MVYGYYTNPHLMALHSYQWISGLNGAGAIMHESPLLHIDMLYPSTFHSIHPLSKSSYKFALDVFMGHCSVRCKSLFVATTNKIVCKASCCNHSCSLFPTTEFTHVHCSFDRCPRSLASLLGQTIDQSGTTDKSTFSGERFRDSWSLWD